MLRSPRLPLRPDFAPAGAIQRAFFVSVADLVVAQLRVAGFRHRPAVPELQRLQDPVVIPRRERGKPPIAYMVTPGERRYVGGAVIALASAQRERLWKRVRAAGKPLQGFKERSGIEWLTPGLVGRVKHLKGEEELRHASLFDIQEP